MKLSRAMLMPVLLGTSCFVARGATITFNTPAGSSVADGPVSASAAFLVEDGLLTITLSNLLANTTSVGQNVSDLQFSLSSSTSPILMNSFSIGDEITVNEDGTTTAGGSALTGWGFGSFGGGLIVCVICPDNLAQPPSGIQPAHTIIGPGPYTNANSSIAGNSPHNPFLDQSATFVISDPGITSTTTISNVVFSFGTTFGSDVPGEGGGGGGGGGEIPEPVSVILTACGLGALALLRRRLA